LGGRRRRANNGNLMDTLSKTEKPNWLEEAVSMHVSVVQVGKLEFERDGCNPLICAQQKEDFF